MFNYNTKNKNKQQTVDNIRFYLKSGWGPPTLLWC